MIGIMKSTIGLTEGERRELRQQAASRSGRADDGRRVRLILLLAAGHSWAHTSASFFCADGPAVGTVLSTRLTRKLILIVGACLIFAALPFMLLNQHQPLWEPPSWSLRHRFALGPNILTSDVWQQMFWDNAEKYTEYRNAVTSIADRVSGGVGLIVGDDKWEFQLWRMLNENQSAAPVHIEHVCLPESGSPRLIFQPEIMLAITPDRPSHPDLFQWRI